VSSSDEVPEVKPLSGASEIAINGCASVILGVHRTVMEELTVSFFLLEGMF
jgi:hypothetical protein